MDCGISFIRICSLYIRRHGLWMLKQKPWTGNGSGFFFAQTERIETERMPTDFARAERKEARVNFLRAKYGVFSKIYAKILDLFNYILYF